MNIASKIISILILFAFSLIGEPASAEPSSKFPINESRSLSVAEENRLADAIYIIEGGNRTKWPYGIKKTFLKTTPRQACINTIRSKRAEWLKTDRRKPWLDFLADRYCPQTDDPVGNRNWKANIRKALK